MAIYYSHRLSGSFIFIMRFEWRHRDALFSPLFVWQSKLNFLCVIKYSWVVEALLFIAYFGIWKRNNVITPTGDFFQQNGEILWLSVGYNPLHKLRYTNKLPPRIIKRKQVIGAGEQLLIKWRRFWCNRFLLLPIILIYWNMLKISTK